MHSQQAKALGFAQQHYLLSTWLQREDPIKQHFRNNQLPFAKQEAEGQGTHTHLCVERELHMGFLSEAELAEVIENCQEMVIRCHCVFITDAQL